MKLNIQSAFNRGRKWWHPDTGYAARRRVFNWQRGHKHPALVSASRRGKLLRT